MPDGFCTANYTPDDDIVVSSPGDTRRFRILNLGDYRGHPTADGSEVVVAETVLGVGTYPADEPIDIAFDSGAEFASADALVFATARIGAGPGDPGGCLSIAYNDTATPCSTRGLPGRDASE